MDIVNNKGHTPYDAVTTGKFTRILLSICVFHRWILLIGRYSISISGVAKIILRTQTKLSLTCMAAKVIKTYNLSYRGNVPRSLESFIELHGPGLNQSWQVFNIATKNRNCLIQSMYFLIFFYKKYNAKYLNNLKFHISYIIWYILYKI